MKYEILKTKYGHIEYTSIGNGKPILFIHGGHSNCWETLIHKGFDENKYQLITPSRPGYGQTTLQGNESAKQTATLLAELIRILRLDKVVVYGISAGGLSSIELASNYPELVDKLVLASAVTHNWLDKKGEIYKTAKLMFNPHIEKITWAIVKLFAKLSPQLIAKSFQAQFSTSML
jgi:pimeloyl-ACP methyl ester carboxylesterase